MQGSTILGSLTLHPQSKADELLIETIVQMLTQGGSIDITAGDETHCFVYLLPSLKVFEIEGADDERA